jgi:hypothetical protein
MAETLALPSRTRSARGRQAMAAAAAGGALSLAALLLGQSPWRPPMPHDVATAAVVVAADSTRTADTTTGLLV